MDIVNGGGVDSEKDIVNAVKNLPAPGDQRRPMVFVTLSRS